MASMRLRTGVIAIIVIAVALTSGWAISRTVGDSRAHLTQALDALPASTRLAGFTDWARIRDALGVDASSPANDLADKAFTRGLSERSVLADAAPAMSDAFGWSIADLDWEVYGQSAGGSVAAAGMGTDLDRTIVERGLKKAKYVEEVGIWSADTASTSAAGGALPDVVNYAAVFDGLVYFSSDRAYLAAVVTTRRDHRPTLAGVSTARQAANPLRGAASAYLADGRDECKSAGFADQDESVRNQARSAVKPYGALRAYRYAGRAIFDDGDASRLVFAMTFDSGAIATRQAALRSNLTTGQFIGRAGSMKDVLTLDATHTDGPTIALDFQFNRAYSDFLSGLGPVLFAACSA